MSDLDWDLLSSYAGLLSLATLSVYAGSYGSLKAPKRPKDSNASVEEEDDEDEDIPDRLSATDAYLFPILGSVMLFGMYLVVKFLGKEWINWLLGWYFSFAGAASVWKCSISLTKLTVGRERWKSYSNWKLLLLKGPWEIFDLSLRTPSLLLFIPSLIPSFLYQYLPGPKKPALLTDILALSFSHNALSLMKLDNFKTGVILLSGLFLYDVWWVFGTEVMVKVAVSLDIPIKILWPKSLTFDTQRGFTMLGLGDIVMPGVFVATALRYDLSRSAHKDPKQSFRKPYFIAALTAYVLGLVTTMAVMHLFRAAQPALLYLSPACILSFFITSFVEGDFGQAWKWTDEVISEDEKATDASKAPSQSQTLAVSSMDDPAKNINTGNVDVLTKDAPEDQDVNDNDDVDGSAEPESEGKKRKKKGRKGRN